MTIVLHEHPLSPYAQKVRIMLREKGIAFEVRMPPGLGTGDDPSGYAQFNPRLEVPALVHEGATIFDSTVILEYLEETFPDPAMLPEKPIERANARMLEEVCDTHYEAINWGLGEVRFFGRGGDTLGPVLRAKAVEQVGHMHAWLEARLGGKDWLTGDRFGWGDIAAVPYVTMSSMFGIDPAPESALGRWLERARARPSVARTVEEALATIPFMETLSDLVSSGAFVRHYRDHRLEWMIRSGGLQVVVDGVADGTIRFTDTARFSTHHPATAVD